MTPSARKIAGINIYDFEGVCRDIRFGLDIQVCPMPPFRLFVFFLMYYETKIKSY